MSHKWVKFKTCIGDLWECSVCRTWTTKFRDKTYQCKSQCSGKEIR